MHKKLAADLTSLAHSILQIKNKEDVFLLKEKAYEVYEKLALLAYVEEYINTTPNATQTKEELLEKIENTLDFVSDDTTEVESITAKVQKIVKEMGDEEKPDTTVELKIAETVEEKIVTEVEETKKVAVNEIVEQPFDELEQTLFSANNQEKNDVKDVAGIHQITLEEELDDTISVEIAADLFEKVEEKKSVNDQFQQHIQIGLNDRIAFVKHLFEGNQEDFNRVISQLNTTKTLKEAKKFIAKMVKPEYNWATKEEYEERFMEIVERKFA
ncbi:MAG: hypothetical protein HWD85_11685 [Flavobacteriaceae bacterium]|nr:hypothetical protein [Flavobacteriaceae bacterium]